METHMGVDTRKMGTELYEWAACYIP